MLQAIPRGQLGPLSSLVEPAAVYAAIECVWTAQLACRKNLTRKKTQLIVIPQKLKQSKRYTTCATVSHDLRTLRSEDSL